MNQYEPNTSLNLSLSPTRRNLGLGLDGAAPSSPLRMFSCNYCRRKFYSSQALGGHQNAHKLERTLAKKSRELSSVLKQHSASDPARVGRTEVIGYGHGHARDDQDDLDLSLRL